MWGGEAERDLGALHPSPYAEEEIAGEQRAALIHSALSKGHHQLLSLCPLWALSPELLGAEFRVAFRNRTGNARSCGPVLQAFQRLAGG